MARGIGLACERCDFSATLSERVPFSLDSSGEPSAIPADDYQLAAGYWTDGLCGACRLPVRAAHWNGLADEPPARCPGCGAEPLAFASAVRELAEACHSRVWLDYARERSAAHAIEVALAAMPGLRDSVATGDLTTLDALDALAELFAAQHGAPDAATCGQEMASGEPLVELRPLIENAHDLAAAAYLLRERLQECEAHSAALRLCIEDEEYLPGVPCPSCEQGHLVHWPLWS
jgi:hypothetical protein